MSTTIILVTGVLDWSAKGSACRGTHAEALSWTVVMKSVGGTRNVSSPFDPILSRDLFRRTTTRSSNTASLSKKRLHSAPKGVVTCNVLPPMKQPIQEPQSMTIAVIQ